MKFIILVSNLKEISYHLTFSPENKKNIYNKLRCHSTVKIRFGRKKILNYAYRIRVEKWSRSVSHLFLIFTQSLLNLPFCVVFV